MKYRIPATLLAALTAIGLFGCLGSGGNSSDSSARTASRPGHVFVILLENKGYDTTFGANSPAPYLSQTLRSQGSLLTHYYGIGHNSLTNYVALVSGQAPNLQTQADCQLFSDWIGPPLLDGNGQAIGTGCVYPASVATLGNQLRAAGLSWKGYMEDMGKDLARDGSATCAHPALNSRDSTQSATASDNYAARHNPFVYFHSHIDDQADCDRRVVSLDQLDADLQSVATTPNYAFITPNLCNDGHDAPCADGRPGGLVSADAFLKDLVPRIMASPAFQQDGLLIVTFDEAEVSDDSTACCGESAGPNTPFPGLTGPGGGRVGAVAVSPFIKPGSSSDTPYNHYALLRSVEDFFGLSHLGMAAGDSLKSFGSDVLNQP